MTGARDITASLAPVRRSGLTFTVLVLNCGPGSGAVRLIRSERSPGDNPEIRLSVNGPAQLPLTWRFAEDGSVLMASGRSTVLEFANAAAQATSLLVETYRDGTRVGVASFATGGLPHLIPRLRSACLP